MYCRKITIITLLFLCTVSSSAQQTKLTLKPYKFKSQSGKIIDAELGKFSVPENRSDSKTRSIDLSFVRFKSTNPNPGNPIVYLAGGPGGSGIGAARGARFKLFMDLRKVSDVIAFDQRGTGLSNQIPNCKTRASFPLDQPGKNEVYIGKMAEAAKKCISFWKKEGVQIEGYTTKENANDLEDLRKVLGVEKINLWGISYGSHLAFDFIKRYEQSIDKVVLAGLEGPNHTIKLPEYNQNFLKNLNAKVQQDEKASKVYPNLLQLMGDVFSALDKQPVYIEIIDPRSKKKMNIGISKLDVQLVTSFFLTKNPQDAAKLPFLFLQMKQGDYSSIAQMVAGIKSYAGRMQAMPLIMDAASGVSKKRWRKIKRQTKNSLLERTTNFPYPDLSENLGLPDLGRSFRKNPVSSLPVLFFSGTLDGRTYLESAKELNKGFRNGKHIIIDGAGHDLFMSTPKVSEFMLDFFQNKKLHSQTIKIKTPNFVLPN